MNIQSLFAAARGLFVKRHIKHRGYRVGRKDGPSLAEIKAEIKTSLETRDAEINKLVAKANAEAEEAGKVSKETAEAIKAAIKSATDLGERLLGMEQELVKIRDAHKSNERTRVKSAGEQFVEDTDVLAFIAKHARGTALIQVKTINNIGTLGGAGGSGAVGVGVVPDYLPGIITPALRPFTIRDLILPGRTGSNLITYVQETGYQNEAASVAEGAAKPQSDLTFTRLNSPVQTLAHWVRASNQILADLPQLQTYIDTRLTYGLKYVEEVQILAGDGTGSNLLGLIPQATAFNTALTKPGDTKIDTIRKAILQVRIAEYRASGIVLNPIDWTDIELTKNSQGTYIWANVATGIGQLLWRLPVVDTNAMPSGKFMVGAFNMAAQIFDREDANIQVSSEDADNFTKNMVTIRVEERLAMVVYRPQSFVYGTFPESGSGVTT